MRKKIKNIGMGNKMFVGLLLFAALLCGCGGRISKERKVGNMYVQNAFYDFGTIKKTDFDNVPFSFVLQNTANVDIEISSVEPSCDCLKIEGFPRIVRANEVGELKGCIDLHNQNGEISKSIYVDFDRGNVMLLRVVGNVE